jgi:phosphatidylethanolamine/phosphatidyl-N-methylethanolamine N-methyltransferase
MGNDIDRDGVAKAYARWAPIYDLVFGAVFEKGRRASIAAADRVGGRVLDVGVGTGLSLSDYAPTTRLCGVDLSEPMLRKAQERARERALRQVAGLSVMDAMRLGFADACFDAAVAPYVITTVPNPEATLDELVRVVRPGGEVVLVNHVSAENGPRAAFERWLARQTRHLGWRPEFPWARITDWCAARPDVDLVERRPIPPFGFFTLVRLVKRPAAARPVPAAA